MTLRILYNGDCPICSREIAHYRRQAASHGADIAFEDIAGADLAAWGLSADAARRRLHACDGGKMLHGMAAFRALWARLPGWRWLARLAGLPFVGAVFALAYDEVAAPLLHRLASRRKAGKARIPGAQGRRPLRCPPRRATLRRQPEDGS